MYIVGHQLRIMFVPSESERDKQQFSFYKLVFYMPNPLSSVKTKYFLRFIMKHQLQNPCLQVDKEYFSWVIDIVIYLNYCKSEKYNVFS